MEAPKQPTFNIHNAISQALSTHDTNTVGISVPPTIFRGLIHQISAFHEREVTTMRQLRIREDKTLQGRTWELFCRDWLRTETVTKYSNVWLLSEAPNDVLKRCDIVRLDVGIDLIAELAKEATATLYDTTKHPQAPNSRYIAVQCKYRAPNIKGCGRKLPWTTLSTFTGLCSITGPWVQGLIMTNASGLGSKVPKHLNNTTIQNRRSAINERFTTLAFGTFNNTKREHWLRMCGDYVEHRLDRPTTISNIPITPPLPSKITPPHSSVLRTNTVQCYGIGVDHRRGRSRGRGRGRFPGRGYVLGSSTADQTNNP